MMIKTKAPLRINFAGGGTDIEPYLSDYGSYILSAAIKVYARAIYESPHYAPQTEIEKILLGMSGGSVRIIEDAYLGGGLGGSASCFVAGIKAIYPSLSNDQIAKLAYYLERNVWKLLGGIQDQYCAAYGGLMFMVFEGSKAEINRLDAKQLSKYLMLVYTGPRKVTGHQIIQDQLTRYNVKALHRQKQISRDMRDCLVGGNMTEFGQLLDEAWQTKKELSPLVSHESIDALYTQCLSLGAIGGTIMGAGAGGYFLLMENPQTEGELRQNLLAKDIVYQNIEFDTDGVQIVSQEA